MWPYGFWNGAQAIAGSLVALVIFVTFWAVIIWLILSLVRPRHDHPHSHASAGPGDEPRRILDVRFARGEIDEEEYRRRRDLLGPGG